jgi:hypothetical protein
MERETRRLDLRPLLAIAAVVVVALTIWVAGALAAGGSGSSPSSDLPATVNDPLAQAGDVQARSRENCPENRGGSGGGGGNQAPQSSNGSGGADV